MLLTRCQGPFPGDDDSDRDRNGSLSLYTQYSILIAAFPKGHYYDPCYTEEETRCSERPSDLLRDTQPFHLAPQPMLLIPT